MDRVTVGRGRCHELVYEVTQEGSILQWEFITSEYDIGFGISLSVHGNAVELVRELADAWLKLSIPFAAAPPLPLQQSPRARGRTTLLSAVGEM